MNQNLFVIYKIVIQYKKNIKYVLTTFYTRIHARFCGVELGKRNRFLGICHFVKSRNAKLIIGDNCTFRSSSTSNLIGVNRPCILSVHNEGILELGQKCGLSGTVIGCFESITLEAGVRCGANTLITDSDWHPNDPRSGKPSPIHIEENVWIGVNVIVLKGVRIGMNSVIGAGSVVTKNIPANVIAAGNPCKVIKPLANAC